MLPVYICEDDPAIRAFQEDYLKKQILIGEYDMKLVLSSAHPQDILKAVAEAPGRGIYFLDVELKNEPMDGLDRKSVV